MRNNFTPSAGCLIYKIEKSKLSVMLIHRKKKNDWSFPKGRLKKDENIYEGAVREAFEETGKQLILQRYLGFTKKKKENNRKIHYFAAKIMSDDYKHLTMARKNHKVASVKEIDKIEWYSAEKAIEKLTKNKNKKILKKLIKMHEKNKLDIYASALIRHSYAVNRYSWSGVTPDKMRPLTEDGKIVAKKIVPILSNYGFVNIYSSTSTRCIQTVEDYAKKARTEIIEKEEFSELGASADFNETKKSFKKIILKDKNILCSHLPVINALKSEIKLLSTNNALKKISEIGSIKPASVFVFFHNGKKIIDVEFISLY